MKQRRTQELLRTCKDRLDGLNNLTTKNKKKALKQTDDGIDERFISSDNDQKRVKWADLEERKNHAHRKALGFIVGQTETDWKRMSDLYNPDDALKYYKYI
ncbi:hypothetical protein GJ496_009234 [Pomphorhynchus laevis]|nr:hypothetical protein GJ496_009234 [Pomphorhynchus laevis]